LKEIMPTAEEMSSQVAQASGMVSAQAECTVVEALVMMKERAQVHHQSLRQIADAVVDCHIRFGV
jgi:hypothetical protein